MAQESPSRTQDKFMLRMPEGMRDRIKEQAGRYNRSMNAQIVHALQGYFDDSDWHDAHLKQMESEIADIENEVLPTKEEIEENDESMQEYYNKISKEREVETAIKNMKDYIHFLEKKKNQYK